MTTLAMPTRASREWLRLRDEKNALLKKYIERKQRKRDYDKKRRARKGRP